MFTSPSRFLFLTIIGVSILIVGSSPSLLISWIGLELNTLTFIPLIIVLRGQEERKSAITYFLSQSLASVIFLTGSLLSFSIYIPENLSLVLIMTGLWIKIGAAPFHGWLPRVTEGLTWPALFILFTLQKLNPFFIITSLNLNVTALVYVALTSVCIGGIMGLAQTQTRLLLVFSSINHVGWILLSLSLRFQLFLTYFSLYIILLFPIILMFHKFSLWHLNQASNLLLSTSNQVILFCSLLSLGGLPPFLGFLPKWTVLQSLMRSGIFLRGTILVFASLLTLFYYLRLTVASFTLSKNIIFPYLTDKSINSILVLSLLLTLLGLPLSILL